MSDAVFVSEERDRSDVQMAWRYQHPHDSSHDVTITRERWVKGYDGGPRNNWPHRHQASNGHRLWRDDTRRGWWIAAEGVRYVAVEGVPEGQRNVMAETLAYAKESARLLNEGNFKGAPFVWERGPHSHPSVSAYVIDLHDLGPEAKPCEPGPAVPASPRYIVLTAEEMRGMEGRLSIRLTQHDMDIRTAEQWVAWVAWTWMTEDASRVGFGGVPWGCKPQSRATFTHAIIDTQDGWQPATPTRRIGETRDYGYTWTSSVTYSDAGNGYFQFAAVPRATDAEQAATRATYDAAVAAKAKWDASIAPTDAEVVAAMDERCRRADAREPMMRDFLRVGGVDVSMSYMRAARSRELKRLTREAEEKRRLPCRGDDAEDVGCDVPMTLADLLSPFGQVWT